MPWPPEDPDMWAVEAAFGKHNKPKETTMQTPYEASLHEKTSPVTHQVGGDHYAKMKIQPSRFAMANDYDADAFSILKYLSRHRSKDGKQGIEKGISFINIRIDNFEFVRVPGFSYIPIGEYVHVNGFDNLTCQAIRDLHDWVRVGMMQGPIVDHLRHSMNLILGTYR